MNTHFTPRGSRKAKGLASTSLTLAIVGGLVVAFSVNALAASSVGLGTADSFGVLAGAGITNTGSTTINGDIGTFPTTTITGLGSMTINGTNHAGDSVTQGAKTDLITAYNAVAGQPSNVTISADLGGTTLVSGVYSSATSLGLTGTLTLNAAGDPNAAFIFQAGSTLTTAAGSRVALINGAQACNVFWQIGSSATLGTTTDFKGNILALTDITLNTGAEVEGRVLARNGAVTLDTNRVISPTCSNSSSGTPVAEIVYAANIGPLAQGLVCPWGGQYDGLGLCRGSGANPLMNVITTPTASATPTPTASAPVSPSATVPTVTPPTVTPGPTATRTPVVPVQILRKPVGGVDTGQFE
ncbi:MAG: ice-binding family protein [Actinomycetota bacterium]|nr:ice-binding family protein [Actinomycetota bacterium]